MGGELLSKVCKHFSMFYNQSCGGLPDLTLWNPSSGTFKVTMCTCLCVCAFVVALFPAPPPNLCTHTNFMRMTFCLVSGGGGLYIWAHERCDRWTWFDTRAMGWTPFDTGTFTMQFKVTLLKAHTYTFKHCYRGRLQLYTASGSMLISSL